MRSEQALQERVYDLEEEVSYYKRMLGVQQDQEAENVLRERLGLTRMEARFLNALYQRGGLVLTTEAMMTALYGLDIDRPSDEIVKVYTAKVRAQLPKGSIITVRATGLALSPRGLGLMRSVLNDETPIEIEYVAPPEPFTVQVLRAVAAGERVASNIGKRLNASMHDVHRALANIRTNGYVECVAYEPGVGGTRRGVYAVTDKGRARLIALDE